MTVNLGRLSHDLVGVAAGIKAVTEYLSSRDTNPIVMTLLDGMNVKLKETAAALKEGSAGLPAKGHFDLVLIDDDRLVRSVWQLEAARLNKRILVLSEYLWPELIGVDRNVPVFVDLYFGGDLVGYEIAEKLYSQGFRNIYIASGIDLVSKDLPSFVQGASGKDFPIAVLNALSKEENNVQ